MIGNLLSKYIWLTKTIYSADNGITIRVFTTDCYSISCM